MKSEVQHNMFLEIFPKEYFYDIEKSKLIRKIEIEEVLKNDVIRDNPERHDFFEIIIKMLDGKEYIELFELPFLISLGCDVDSDSSVKTLRDTRFNEIKKQLCEYFK